MDTNQTIKYRTCHLCEAMCGLEIKVENEQVLSINGHKEDIYSQGHICPKGVALKDLHEDSNRLKKPMKRTATGWEEISWEEAFDTVEKNFKRIRKAHGNDAIATYTGNPTVHNTGTALYLYDTINAINTKNRFGSKSLDSVAVFVANQMMFGHAVLTPIPDLDYIDYFLVIGANPLASNGSFMSTPNIKGKLKQIQQKGKVVVIDPRKTETAKKASEHYFIIPERDVVFLAAILNEIFRRDAVKESHVLSFTEHIEVLKEVTSPYVIEEVAKYTGLEASEIHHIVDDLLSHENPVVYGRLGINIQSYGSLCQWLVHSINILIGSMDREGGLMFTLPAIDYVALMSHESKMFRHKSRVGNYNEIVGEFPTATLPDEILTEGEGQVKALLTIAGNIARSAPNSALVEKALKKLDFMVAIDIYLNETTKYADIILPPAVGLETLHYSFVVHLIATRNTSKYSSPPLPISKDQRYDWQIIGELQRRLFSGNNLFAKLKNNIMSRLHPETKLDLALKTGPYGIWGGRKFKKDGISLKRLKKQKNGVELSKLKPVFPDRLYTENKTIDIAPEIFVEEFSKVLEQVKADHNKTYPYKLVGRRHLRSNNSWMHNLPLLDGGTRKCTALIHPDDAKATDIGNNELVKVFSEFGSVQIEAEISSTIMKGTICIPHGWGHDSKDTQLDIAAKNAGVNVNELMDHRRLCKLSNNMAFNGQPVAIQKLSN